MKLKLKNFEKIFLKKQSLDKEYIILIQNYEFLSLFVLKILVSVACVICTFDLHPLNLIELQLTDEKNITYLVIQNSKLLWKWRKVHLSIDHILY